MHPADNSVPARSQRAKSARRYSIGVAVGSLPRGLAIRPPLRYSKGRFTLSGIAFSLLGLASRPNRGTQPSSNRHEPRGDFAVTRGGPIPLRIRTWNVSFELAKRVILLYIGVELTVE